ncbi:hypothetical protein [Campylobacter devanensis]|uniref:hypothetical protein n=1 Tax=Campylobacter devanensis TaxID=3161138 RepID=UPI000A33BFAD|nr:hypothetical protein [Campylobacter sp. P0138]
MSKYTLETKDKLIELVNNINLILRYINTSSVTDMNKMFYGCKINDENKPKFTNMYDLMEKDDDVIPF